MSFPTSEYQAVMAECAAIIEDRCRKGRNGFVPFFRTRAHGSQDMTGELWQRITRILGAERLNDRATMRADLLDLVNEAALTILFLDQEASPPPS